MFDIYRHLLLNVTEKEMFFLNTHNITLTELQESSPKLSHFVASSLPSFVVSHGNVRNLPSS